MSAPQTEVLVFVGGREIARHILGTGAHVFGCAESCQVRIEAAQVSPLHARLTVGEDGSLLLEDLGSANGTFLDGQTITSPTLIAPNQSIQIGATQILVLQHTVDGFDASTMTAADGVAAAPEFSQTVRYELGAEIAKGGMGAILAARQPAIRREVALKVMLRNASAHDRLRFIEEAQITGQLEHPNIVPVHDLALNEQGQPYYTMKLVKGSTLKEILQLLTEGDAPTIARYPLAALLTIFQKVCDAVAFAHAKGVIHRDLKPANIMVGDYGEVLLMDWGLAKIIGGTRSSASQTSNADDGRAGARPSEPIIATARDDQRENFATLDGAVMGTPQYMSPEQARGEVATLDQRSDLFSLGAILYEMVTLLPPFPGKTTREILSHVKSGHFVLPNARLRSAGTRRLRHLPGRAISNSLEAIILKALAHDRDQRYERVADFQTDLTAYQTGFATDAENAGPWTQITLFVKRHVAHSIAVVGFFFFMVPIIVVTYALISSVHTLGIRTARHELLGVEYARPLQQVLRDWQLLRGSEATAPEADRVGRRADLQRDLAALDAVDARLRSGLQLSGEWPALADRSRKVLAVPPSAGTQEEMARIARSGLDLLNEVADHSELTLDPELGSCYFVDLCLKRLPEHAELISQAWSRLAASALGQHLEPAARNNLNRLAGRIEFVHAQSNESLSKARAAEPEAGDPLHLPAPAVDAINDALGSDTWQMEPASLAAAMTARLDADYELAGRVSFVLADLLQERIDRLQRRINNSLAIGALSMVFVFALGLLLIWDIVRPRGALSRK